MMMWYFVFVLLKGTILRVARVAKHPVYELCVCNLVLDQVMEISVKDLP